MVRHAAIVYGFPRTGTTLLKKTLERGVGFLPFKLSEWHDLHPVQAGNEDGIYSLVGAMARRTVVVVRTERDVDAVWESMQAGNEMGQDPPHRWGRPEVERMHKQEQHAWDRFVRNYQDRLPERVECVPVTIVYEEMDEPGGIEKYAGRLAKGLPMRGLNEMIFAHYLNKVWKKRPVNVGRLMRQQRTGGG